MGAVEPFGSTVSASFPFVGAQPSQLSLLRFLCRYFAFIESFTRFWFSITVARKLRPSCIVPTLACPRRTVRVNFKRLETVLKKEDGERPKVYFFVSFARH
jgi:hypothetical protein